MKKRKQKEKKTCCAYACRELSSSAGSPRAIGKKARKLFELNRNADAF